MAAFCFLLGTLEWACAQRWLVLAASLAHTSCYWFVYVYRGFQMTVEENNTKVITLLRTI